VAKKKSTKSGKTTKRSSKSTKSSAKKAPSKKKSTKAKSAKKATKKKSKSTKRTAAKSAKKVTKRTTKKKTAASKAAPNGSSKKKPTRKTKLSTRDLKKYLALLMLKRAEILGDMDSMTAEALNIDSANLSHMPLHMADIGSDNYEQELTLGLVDKERERLEEINEAILRINDRTYGICVESGKPIGKARLEAKPWAKYCIEVAREMERGKRRF